MKCTRIDLLLRIKGFFEDNVGWLDQRAGKGDESCFVLFNEMMHLLTLIEDNVGWKEKEDRR